MLTEKETDVQAWFDGSCWPNQGNGGHGGYGAIVRRHEQAILFRSVYIGHGTDITSEVCEYAGINCLFQFFLAQGIQIATLYGDSQMVIQQTDGLAKARRGIYLPLYREAKVLRAQLPDVRLVWISRRSNKVAHQLSRRAIRPYAVARRNPLGITTQMD